MLQDAMGCAEASQRHGRPRAARPRPGASWRVRPRKRLCVGGYNGCARAQVWHRCKMAARWCKMVVAHACGRAVAHRAEGLRSSSVVVGEGVSTRRSAVEVSLGARTVIKRGASEETPKKAVCELGQNE